MRKLIERADLLSDREILQAITVAVVIGIGLGLIVNAVLNPHNFVI